MFPRSVIVVTLLAFSAHADEAVRRDGSRTNGTLSLTANKTLNFQNGATTETLDNLEFVRLAAKPATSKALLLHRVQLVQHEQFIAELLKLDETHLHVRTAWAESLAVPRAAIERVTHLGGQPLLYDTFDGDLTAWNVTGTLKTAAGQVRFEQADNDWNTG